MTSSLSSARATSPAYTPCSLAWVDPVAWERANQQAPREPLGPSWTPPASQKDSPIQFGPGAQEDQQGQENEPTNLQQPAPTFVDRAFVAITPTVLETTPQAATRPTRSKAGAKAMAGRPKSARQAANKTVVPVTKRAQLRLAKELQFVAPGEPFSDKALEQYMKMYKQALSPEAIAALRKALRLNNKKMASAMEALAADQGTPCLLMFHVLMCSIRKMGAASMWLAVNLGCVCAVAIVLGSEDSSPREQRFGDCGGLLPHQARCSGGVCTSLMQYDSRTSHPTPDVVVRSMCKDSQ